MKSHEAKDSEKSRWICDKKRTTGFAWKNKSTTSSIPVRQRGKKIGYKGNGKRNMILMRLQGWHDSIV